MNETSPREYVSPEVARCRILKAKGGPYVYDPKVMDNGNGTVTNVDGDSPWQWATYYKPRYPGTNRAMVRKLTTHGPSRGVRMAVRKYTRSHNLIQRIKAARAAKEE